MCLLYIYPAYTKLRFGVGIVVVELTEVSREFSGSYSDIGLRLVDAFRTDYYQDILDLAQTLNKVNVIIT